MRLILTAILILGNSISYSQDADSAEKFNQANIAFVEGNYDSAIQLYNEILESDFESSELYFNLANSHYKKGNKAESILNYHRAILLAPGNNKYRENLKMVRESIGTDIIEVSEFLPIRIWKRLAQTFNPGSWFVIQVLMAIALFVSIYFWRYKSEGEGRMRFLLLTGVSLVLFFVTISLGYSADQLKYYSNDAVVMKSTALRSGADLRSDQIRSLVEGVTVKIIDRELNDWYKVSLRNKDEGWIERNLIEEI